MKMMNAEELLGHTLKICLFGQTARQPLSSIEF